MRQFVAPILPSKVTSSPHFPPRQSINKRRQHLALPPQALRRIGSDDARGLVMWEQQNYRPYRRARDNQKPFPLPFAATDEEFVIVGM